MRGVLVWKCFLMGECMNIICALPITCVSMCIHACMADMIANEWTKNMFTITCLMVLCSPQSQSDEAMYPPPSTRACCCGIIYCSPSVCSEPVLQYMFVFAACVRHCLLVFLQCDDTFGKETVSAKGSFFFTRYAICQTLLLDTC